MKKFEIENGKEKVFVQVKDLRFLLRHPRTPDNVNSLIDISLINANKQEEFFEFDDKDFIKYMHDSYFILDYDRFNNMSKKEVAEEFENNQEKMDKVIKDIKKSKKNKTSIEGSKDALMGLMYYEQSIINFIEEKRINNGQVLK